MDSYGHVRPPPFLLASELNEELASHIPDQVKLRDRFLKISQNTLGSALAALGQAASALICPDQRLSRDVLQQLVDAGRQLTDLMHQQSLSRRALVVP